jgi:hypothetical protein
MNKKMQLISKKLYKRNLASFYATACLFGQFDKKKIYVQFSKFLNFDTKNCKGNNSFIKSLR